MNYLPNKVAFTDAAQWPLIHKARHGLPPDDLPGLRQWIHLQHVPGPYDAAIADGIDEVIETHQGSTEAFLAISGPAHLGKTTTLTSHLLERALATGTYRERQPNGRLHTPFVFVEATSYKPSARSVLGDAAVFMGYPDKGTEPVLTRTLAPKFHELNVQAVVVDEAHYFRRATAAAATVSDGLRKLLHLPAPFVFCGKDLDTSALLRDFGIKNDSADQLRERVIRVELEPLTKSVVPIVHMLDALRDRLILIDGFRAPALGQRDAVTVLITAFNGRPGGILETAKIAAADALKTDRILTAELLIERIQRRTNAA